MRIPPDHLRQKALLALEEAVQICRYRRPRRSFALRFALAYLWAQARCGREPFDRLWKVLGDEKSPWSFSAADGALLALYVALEVERDPGIGLDLWEKLDRAEN